MSKNKDISNLMLDIALMSMYPNLFPKGEIERKPFKVKEYPTGDPIPVVRNQKKKIPRKKR